MKSMIYYPGFEVTNDKWLKFALLYIDELRPIIPTMSLREEEYLSKRAIRITNETDLIRPYKPEYREINESSIKACEEFDKYLNSPKLYKTIFKKSSDIDMIELWRNPLYHTYELYDGKFQPIFKEYCIEKGIATPFEEGIKLSKDLAFVYMSLLADVISNKQEYEMFTDNRKYDAFLSYNDRLLASKYKYKLEMAREQIDFLIPTGIESIDINKIIKLRSNPDFCTYRNAFVNQIEEYLRKKEQCLDYSFEEQVKLKREIEKIINSVLGSVAAVCLAYSSITPLLEEGSALPLVMATAYEGVQSVKEIRNLPKNIENIREKMGAKRYVGQIKKILR